MLITMFGTDLHQADLGRVPDELTDEQVVLFCHVALT